MCLDSGLQAKFLPAHIKRNFVGEYTILYLLVKHAFARSHPESVPGDAAVPAGENTVVGTDIYFFLV